MEKFAKGCLIIAGVFIAIGIFLGIIVTVIGGRSFLALVNEQDITWGDTRIISSYTYHGDNGWGWEAWDDIGFRNELVVNDEIWGKEDFEGTVDSQGVKSMYITVGAGQFEIQEWDQDSFGITITGRGECEYYINDGTLYLEGFKHFNIKRNANNNKISLYIPSGMKYDQVNLEVGAGKSDISGFSADRLECNVGMGAAHFSDMDIRNLYMEVGMGEGNFEGQVNGDVIISCGMGSIAMDLEGSETDYNYSLSCAAGSIALENQSFSMLAGEKTINNGADYNISLECAMGSIDVDFAE